MLLFLFSLLLLQDEGFDRSWHMSQIVIFTISSFFFIISFSWYTSSRTFTITIIMNLIKCCTSAHSSSDHTNLSKKKITSAKKGGMFFHTFFFSSLCSLVNNLLVFLNILTFINMYVYEKRKTLCVWVFYRH